MNPAQAAEMSNDGMFTAPSFCCTNTAVAGIGMSGVTVPTMIMSRSAAVKPAILSALSAAAVAMSLVTTSGGARPRRPSVGLAGLLRAGDLAPLVVSARRAGAVRDGGLATLRARDELHRRHLVVVGAPHVALRSAGSSLGDRHGGSFFTSGAFL